MNYYLEEFDAPLLRLMTCRTWFSKCSYELAEIVTNIFNESFADGVVPSQWLTAAVVTSVPKKTSPTSLSDYRPVTPIISRLAEKILVQQWLRTAHRMA